MIFKMKKGLGFSDENRWHDDPVVARKLNGFIVNHNGEECFVPSDVIDIAYISEEEKRKAIRW